MSDTDSFSGLEPSGLWRHFEAMTRIARPSGHEAAMADYVAAWAADRRFEVLRDAVGNVCVRVPGRPPLENAPPVVLQSHMDMVCERDSDSPFDASVGRMRVLREGDWLRADGTTLGADNGIGCSAMMAVAESPDCPHGPLELLFTVDEERGLVGAKNLDPAMLRGRVLLNLDSEDEGLLVVGCAGGRGSTLTFVASRESAPAGWTAGQVCIAGLRGGHSGLEIDKGRLNANKAAARVLLSARQAVRLRLAGLHGGDKTNAIPRECRALVWYPAADEGRLGEAIGRAEAALREQYRGRDDGLTVALRPPPTDVPPAPFTDEASARLLDLICALPFGVLAVSPDIPGLVETSNNPGVIRTDGDRVEIKCSSRSSVPGSLDELVESIAAMARSAKAAVEPSEGYPGWKPDLNSRVLAVTRATYRRLFSKEPAVTAIHAGLECGLIGQRVPDMDMISLGPDIKGVHAPGERVRISSVKPFFDLLAAVLHDLVRQP